MPIQINPLQAAGLAQLSGGVNVPRLDLKNTGLFAGMNMTPGQIALEAAQANAQLQNQRAIADQQNRLGYFTQAQENARAADNNYVSLFNNQNTVGAQIRGQDVTANTEDLNRQQKAEYDTGRNKIAAGQLIVAQQNADQTGQYQQGQLDNAQMKNHIDAVHQELQDRAKMTEIERQGRSAFGAGYVATAPNVDPAKRDAFDQNYIEQGIKAGYITKEEGDQFLKLPPEQRIAAATMDTALTNKAGELAKTLNPDGGQIIQGTDANGNPTQSIAITKKDKEDAMSTIKDYTPIQKQLDTWITNWKPVYDTYAKETSGFVGKVEGKLGLGSTNTQEFINKLTEARSDLSGLILNIASTLKNSRSPLIQQQLKEMMPNEEDSPAAVEGKQKAIQRFINNHMNEAKGILQEQKVSIDKRSDTPVEYSGKAEEQLKMIRVMAPDGRVGSIPENDPEIDKYKRI